MNEEIEGEEYIEENGLDIDIFVPRERTVLEEWDIDISLLEDGVYDGGIDVPTDLKEFRGLKEIFGFEIKEVTGYLSFVGCKSLTSVSNLPEIRGGIYFSRCTSLTSISNLPERIGGSLSFEGCISLKSLPNLPKTIGWFLDFESCTSLTSLPNLPEYVGGDLFFKWCTSLTSIPNIPSVVKGNILTYQTPFFEGMNEEQIREKYNISR